MLLWPVFQNLSSSSALELRLDSGQRLWTAALPGVLQSVDWFSKSLWESCGWTI